MAGWWEAGTIYQVYPRSFADSDGDGVGDLEGVRRRLPYLRALGVDAVWLSPIFVSPMADFGYDIADYRGIDPLFGTMADFDRLLADAHGLALRVLLDLVPNHTSDQHPWFVESRSSRDNPKRDWYLWRDSKPDGSPPNNWMSNFGGPAWEPDPATSQSYLHSFLPQQPDLNWRNPDVLAAMLDVMRFWFDRGVDGFRIDVLWLLVKDAQLRDNPPNPDWKPGDPDIRRLVQLHNADQPEVHEIIAAMRALADGYPEPKLLIGEIYLPLDRLMTYYGPDRSGVQLPFNFQLITAPWDAAGIAAIIAGYEAALPQGGWPNWVLGNHDQPRVAARVGERQARVAQVLLLTLRGTPTLYYGDELGMGRVPIPPDRVRDPQALREPGVSFNRDEARTPMRWTGGAGAGFSDGEPWLPLGDDVAARNVAAEQADPTSMLSLVRQLLALRRAEPALRTGRWAALPAKPPVLAYERIEGDDRLAVFLNLSHAETTVHVPLPYRGRPPIIAAIAATAPDRLGDMLALGPDQALVVKGARA